MSSEIAIQVENISKCYQIYEQPRDRLKQSIYPRLQRLSGAPIKQYYREFWALKNISLEIKKGETVGIIGQNGSGKSTLLQLICGTLNPTSGTIKTNGRIAALLELGSGFNPDFTGRENIFMNAAVLGLSREETEASFDDIVAFADIGNFIEQPVKTYSSGMTVRLAFAVIAHVNADILVVDEALAVGDAFFTQKCMRFLREFMKTGTVLFVSHDTAAVVNLCNKATLLDRGSMIAEGHPKDIAERYLAKLYASSQDIQGIHTTDQPKPAEAKSIVTEYRDMRQPLIDGSTLRNDIEVFKFNPEEPSGFGSGGTFITSVRLLTDDKAPLSWVIGGEDVSLEIRCTTKQALTQPIIGFQFKDRLGQIIFADNTFIAYQFNAPRVEAGKEIIASFDFRLPILPPGDYSITVAIADGSQDKHVQHHWIHEALVLRVHASAVCAGLVGIPMKEIRLTINQERLS